MSSGNEGGVSPLTVSKVTDSNTGIVNSFSNLSSLENVFLHWHQLHTQYPQDLDVPDNREMCPADSESMLRSSINVWQLN
ncbi:hypothetical protein V3C99_001110 [Haemonchus contortus]